MTENEKDNATNAVPPPSIEADIRTMESDIKMMGKTGGAPFHETVSLRRETSPVVPQRQEAVQPPPQNAPREGGNENIEQVPLSREGQREEKTTKALMITVAIVVGFATLFFAGFYLYPLLFNNDTAAVDTIPGQTDADTNIPSENIPPVSATPEESSASLPKETGSASIFVFATTTDATLTLNADTLTKPVIRAMTDLLAAKPDTQFAEVFIQHADQRPLSWKEFLELSGAELDAQFFDENFEKRFTAFLYRNKDGIWPGFVLEPAQGKLPVLLRSQAARIESVRSFASFFPSFPGAPEASWQSMQIAEVTARALSHQTTGLLFIYGWGKNDFLIISTSQDGFREAIERLR